MFHVPSYFLHIGPLKADGSSLNLLSSLHPLYMMSQLGLNHHCEILTTIWQRLIWDKWPYSPSALQHSFPVSQGREFSYSVLMDLYYFVFCNQQGGMRWSTTEITSFKLNLKIINTQKQVLTDKCKPHSLLLIQHFNSYTFLCLKVCTCTKCEWN